MINQSIAIRTPQLEEFIDIFNIMVEAGYLFSLRFYSLSNEGLIKRWLKYQHKTCLYLDFDYVMVTNILYFMLRDIKVLTTKEFYEMFGGCYKKILKEFK